MLANMTHVFPAKKYIYSYVFSTGLRCAMLASMIHVGEHDSCWRAWLTSSTALLYQILRWNLSRNFSWVRKKSLFKLGFQVPLSNGRIFRCYNATETRVREITRHRVKQIILLSHRVFSAEVPEIRPLVSETRLFFRTTIKFRPLANLLYYYHE